MKHSTAAWIEFAAKDLLAAKNLKKDETLANISCFHSQQTVEKSLKALLEDQEIIPPKTHDLIRLYDMCRIDLDLEEDMLAQLNEVYLDSRYPITVGHLPTGFPAVDDAEVFYNFAETIHRQIKSFIESR